MQPKGKYVPLANMQERWIYLEDELIQLAIQKEFKLYCFKSIPFIVCDPLERPFFIVGKELWGFLPGKSSISCSRFPFRPSDCGEGLPIPVTPEDRKPVYRVGLHEIDLPSVTVDRSDLFLHEDEIADMEKRHPEVIKEKKDTHAKEEKSELAKILDPTHPWHSENLALAINCWLEVYASRDGNKQDNTFKPPGGNTQLIKVWLKNKKPDIGETTEEHFRVVINPSKKGGPNKQFE